MKNFLRRFFVPVAAALSLVPASLAAPPQNVVISSPPNGSQIVVAPGSPVIFTATAVASATNQTITSIDFRVNGVTIGTVMGGAANVTLSFAWEPLAVGTYTLTAIATDSSSATGNTLTSNASTVNVTSVTAPATSVQQVGVTAPASFATIAQNSQLMLRGTAYKSDGVVQQVEFILNGGGGPRSLGVATTAPYGVAATFSDAPGSYTIVARATASDLSTFDSPAIPITIVAAAGLAPTATLTTPSASDTVSASSNVTVAATATDADGTIASVTFFADGEQIGATDTTAPYTVTWTPTLVKAYTLRALVVDNNNNSRFSAPVTVNVTVATPTVAITAPTAGQSFAVGANVTVSASAIAGVGLSVINVQFLANGTPIGTDTTSPFSIVWTPSTPGPAILTARATDSVSGLTVSAPVTVSVITGAGTPTAALTVAGGNSIPAGSTRTVTVTTTPTTGIDRVELLLNDAVIGTDNAAPYAFLFTAPNQLGLQKLEARVFDVTGLSSLSSPVNVTVTGATGVPPVIGISSPTPNAFLAAATATTISGTVSDADGTITGVQVFVNDTLLGGSVTLGSGTWSVPWTTPATPGLASIVAIASDNNGNSVAAPAVGVNIAEVTSPGITLGISPIISGQAANTTFPSGAVKNFVATVTPALGRAVVRVEFFVNGTKVGEDTTAPHTFRYIAPELNSGEASRAVVFGARATDNAGAARDVQVPLLVVTPVGQPPTVNLVTPANNASVVPNSPVSLATTAVANGGTVSSVQFYVNGSPASINAGNAVITAPYVSTFTPTTPGTYVVDAIATDDRGNTSISNASTITAAFSTPTVTITSPNPNATARATPNVPLNITAAAVVSSGSSVLLVEFLLDGVQIGADTTAPYTFSWTPTATQLGQRVLTARVTDTNSQTATSAPVNVNVANLVGTPPTITITTQPIPGQGLQTLSQVSFIANAAASATGVTISNVEFFLNDVSIGSAVREQTTNIYRLSYDFSRFDFATAPSITDPNTGVTRYTPIPVYAIARDSNNNQTVSTTTNLTINPSTSSSPSLQLVALSPTTITQGQQFFILPNFADSDGTVAQIQLFANGTAAAGGAIGNPQLGQILTFTPTAAGRFNLYAVATDDSGNTVVSSPSIVVTVNAVAAPTTTITRPGDNNTTTTVGAPVFLEGTAESPNPTFVPTLQFIITASGGGRTTINGTRVGTTTAYRAIWTPTAADTYQVSTQASIGATASGTSTVSRRVVVSNLVALAPTISITNPPGTATTASTVNLTATATDSDGSVVEVEFFLNRNSIGLATRDQLANTWRLTASFAGVPLGAAEVVARARDSSGNVAASTTVNINVTAAAGIAPLITITPSTVNAAFNRQVQLRANARDSDGTVSSVQYFANNTSLGTSGNAGTSYQVTWTPTASGTFNVWAVATDNSGITTVAQTVEITVRRNNPILEDAAFILQTYQDIANTTNINPLLFDDIDARLSAGTLTRAELAASLVTEPGFLAPVNLLAAYWVLMGQWPTPTNYNALIGTARGSLANAMGSIITSNEYILKYGVAPTAGLLNSPTSLLPADVFITRLWQGAGLGSPSALDNTRFRNNNVLSATTGRGYNPVGLSQALAEFITNTNSGNVALFNRARVAALYYQLARPPIEVSVDQISARVTELAALPDTKAVVDAILKDVLYGYRYVTITRHPQSLVVNPRSGALFSVEAQGAPPLAYQWLLNGAPIPGATSPTLSLINVDASRVGTYTVAITSSAATATSDPATLTLSTTATRLGNISTRGVTSGDAVLIGGFIVSGANQQQTRQMLIRVVGPRLATAPFNVTGVLANPRLEVYAGNNATPVLQNDDWGTQAGGAAQVTAIQQATNRAGAFALAANSADAVVLATLPPGPYTVQAKGPANTPNASGVVLIEVYDVTANAAAPGRAANVSTRGAVGTGSNIIIAGFVVNGTASRRVLVRGVGPTLASFGVPGLLADPQITLVDQASGRTLRTNNDWASGDDAAIIASASTAAGAFPLANGSRDAAMVLMLPPGPYTVQLSGVNNGTGVGIIEVYDVDP
jgi:hypothetical protein